MQSLSTGPHDGLDSTTFIRSNPHHIFNFVLIARDLTERYMGKWMKRAQNDFPQVVLYVVKDTHGTWGTTRTTRTPAGMGDRSGLLMRWSNR